jgi:hypothetical protein
VTRIQASPTPLWMFDQGVDRVTLNLVYATEDRVISKSLWLPADRPIGEYLDLRGVNQERAVTPHHFAPLVGGQKLLATATDVGLAHAISHSVLADTKVARHCCCKNPPQTSQLAPHCWHSASAVKAFRTRRDKSRSRRSSARKPLHYTVCFVKCAGTSWSAGFLARPQAPRLSWRLHSLAGDFIP